MTDWLLSRNFFLQDNVLNVVSDNIRAIEMYKAMGFVEFGRNPRGFKSRINGYQEVISMYKSLK